MKIVEWTVNLVFRIASLWDRSSDMLVNEHRSYERKVLIYTILAILFLIITAIVSPTVEMNPSDGIKFFSYTIHKYLGLGALSLGALYTVALIWNIVGLLYFRYKYGISD